MHDAKAPITQQRLCTAELMKLTCHYRYASPPHNADRYATHVPLHYCYAMVKSRE